mmetsp:Transcript_22217/g.31830  ORF Transcript_22217/g.31830 Transcript_22217/m.31830 type:complete len:109 (-) Transcript_22217:953-1279(-)
MSHHHCDLQEQPCPSGDICTNNNEKTLTLRLTFVDPETSKRNVQCISSLFSSSSIEQLFQICTFIEADKAMKNNQQQSPKKTKRSTAAHNTSKKTRITGEGITRIIVC